MPIAKLAAFLDMVSKREMILCRSHFLQLVCFYCLHGGSKKGVQDNHNGNGRRTMVLYVRYNSLYNFLSSSAKQQREMTNSALSDVRELRRLFFLNVYFKFIAVSQIPFGDSFDSDKQT